MGKLIPHLVFLIAFLFLLHKGQENIRSCVNAYQVHVNVCLNSCHSSIVLLLSRSRKSMSVIISIGIKSSLLDVVIVFIFHNTICLSIKYNKYKYSLNRSSSVLQQECLNKAQLQMDYLFLPAIG